MFTENANRIFNRSIEDYHRWDDVDHPIDNPYAPGTIDHLLYHKNWIDTVQWHLEDIIRDPEIDPAEALKIKRRIDKSNQDRTDMVEYVDSYLLDKYKEVVPTYFESCIGTEWNVAKNDSQSDRNQKQRLKIFLDGEPDKECSH